MDSVKLPSDMPSLEDGVTPRPGNFPNQIHTNDIGTNTSDVEVEPNRARSRT